MVLNNLYKHTKLQMSYGITLLAIVANRPHVLNLLQIVEHFIDFRREVVRRRTEFELRKAEARAHILEGLKIALDHLDEVITLIRASKTTPEAREGLMTNFGLSQLQAQAILDMQLQRLTGLERQKIIDELTALLTIIERLRAILSNDELIMAIVIDELKAVREKYGDERRTEIIEDSGELRVEDLIADEDVVITATNTGYVKRTALTEYRKQRRGGKGLIGMQTRDEDVVRHLFIANTHAYILIFSDRGKCYWLRVYDIPEVSRSSKGKSIANLVQMAEGEKIAALLKVQGFPEEEDQRFIVMGTQQGTIKKTDLKAFSNPRAAGIIAIQVDDNDALISVAETDGNKDLVIGTRRRHGDSIQRRRCASDGAHGLWRARHPVCAKAITSWPWKSSPTISHAAHRLRKRLRQTHRGVGVSRADAWRHWPQEHSGHRSQRHGRRHCVRQ